MAHLSAEQLAGLAADPDHPLPPDERAHLASCRSCRDEAAELSDLVRDVRSVRSSDVVRPSPAVWAAVVAEVAADEPTDRRRAGSEVRRHRAVVVVAAAAGLAIGVGGTLGVLATRPTSRPADPPDAPALIASTVLAPLPGEAGEGTAELVRDDDTLQLRVHASLGTAPVDDYREVWLLNGDGRRMFALGVLPSSGDASYWLPPPLADRLDGYETVDISLEPEDGDTAHSQHSLVRGRLPG